MSEKEYIGQLVLYDIAHMTDKQKHQLFDWLIAQAIYILVDGYRYADTYTATYCGHAIFC